MHRHPLVILLPHSITPQNLVIERRPEQFQHGQVCPRMPTVRSRINHDRSILLEQHIARPQITVDSRRRNIPIDRRNGISRRKRALAHPFRQTPEKGLNTLLRVKFTPPLARLAGLLHPANKVGALPPRRWRTESRSSRLMHSVQRLTKCPRSGGTRARLPHTPRAYRRPRNPHDLSHHALIRLSQPPQPGSLRTSLAGRRNRLCKNIHAPSIEKGRLQKEGGQRWS